jgi:hypothetical protein
MTVSKSTFMSWSCDIYLLASLVAGEVLRALKGDYQSAIGSQPKVAKYSPAGGGGGGGGGAVKDL